MRIENCLKKEIIPAGGVNVVLIEKIDNDISNAVAIATGRRAANRAFCE